MLKEKAKFDLDQFFDRARKIAGCDSDVELSKYCGFKATNQIATYRHRESLSMTGLNTIISSLNPNVNLNWLFYGEGEPYIKPGDGQYSTLLLRLLDQMGLDTSGPEVRTINNQFLMLINDIDDEQEKAKQVTRFIGTLMNYVLHANSDKIT